MMYKIDIVEPIWKSPRSIGLNVKDIPLGEKIEVSISYKNKNGKLLYPGNWIVSADLVRTYPTKSVRSGIKVHIVPITDLNKLSINQNIKQMLFDKKSLDKIITASEEASFSSSKKNIEPGKHLLTVVNITLDHSKKDGNPMIVMEFEKDEEHRTFKEFFKIAGPNTDIPREKLVKVFHRGFGYSIQPCKDEQGLIDQLVPFKEKQLSVAVKGRKKIISYEKDGKAELLEVTDPQFWYCGTASDFDSLTFDATKAITDLTDDDKDKLIKFAELQGDGPKPEAESKPEPAAKEEKPAKVSKKKEKKEDDPPAPVTTDDDDDDDEFPF